MMRTVAVQGYRSLRELVLALGQLSVITGANGSGKSSVYRSLRLLADVAQNAVVASLAREGGLPFAFWAGPKTIARSVNQGTYAVEGQAQRGKSEARLRQRHLQLQHRPRLPSSASSSDDVWIGPTRETGVHMAWSGLPESIGVSGQEKQFCLDLLNERRRADLPDATPRRY